VPSKSLPQIKNFFYDYKKQAEKKSARAEKKAAKAAKDEKSRKEQPASRKRKSPPPNPPTPPPSAEPTAMFLPQDDSFPTNITEEMLNDPQFQQHLHQRQLEILQRNQMMQREQELQELQRQAQMERSGQQYGEAEARPHAELSGPQSQAELLERLLAGSGEHNSDLIQQLLSRHQAQAQQQQQPQRHPSIDLTLHQQQSPALQPQSALHQLL
ncbi:MAG: hypothetical protein SGARI_004954, partial [Bacillariaceae sp.]